MGLDVVGHRMVWKREQGGECFLDEVTNDGEDTRDCRGRVAPP